MKKILLSSALTIFAFSAVATNAGFGLDAFNRTVSAAVRGNAVFSPVSFEIDCVVFSEACNALTRAKFAETMGVLNGLESVYQPIYTALAQADHEFSFLSARAFCLPDEQKAHPAFRRWIQQAFAAEAFGFNFRRGAECWFRARMEGNAESFSIPDDAAIPKRYSYFSIVDFRCSWDASFSTNGITSIDFQALDGSTRKLPALCGTCATDIWKRKTHTMLRMPILGGCWFFILQPKKGMTVRDIRNELNSTTLHDIVNGITSVTETGLSHGRAFVRMPVIDVSTECDFTQAFEYFQFPVVGMDRLEKGISPKYFNHRTRFRIEKGPTSIHNAGAAATASEVQSIIDANIPQVRVDGPFLYFVLHEPTSSIPVVGQFTGM